MPDTMICTADAAKIMRCSASAVRDRAVRLKWETQLVAKSKSRRRLMFKLSDVENYKNVREAGIVSRRQSAPDKIRDLVEWANKLRRWPSDETIKSKTSFNFRVKDVEGVIDTRVFRKVRGKYLVARREPAMKREDSILGG